MHTRSPCGLGVCKGFWRNGRSAGGRENQIYARNLPPRVPFAQSIRRGGDKASGFAATGSSTVSTGTRNKQQAQQQLGRPGKKSRAKAGTRAKTKAVGADEAAWDAPRYG